MNSEDAWFVRRGSGWCTSIRPAGIKGVLLTGVFVAVIELLTLWLNRHDGAYWPISLVAVICATILFVTVCYRLSAPRDPS
jgi:hypothetical protein